MTISQAIILLVEVMKSNGDVNLKIDGEDIKYFMVVPVEEGFPAYVDLTGR